MDSATSVQYSPSSLLRKTVSGDMAPSNLSRNATPCHDHAVERDVRQRELRHERYPRCKLFCFSYRRPRGLKDLVHSLDAQKLHRNTGSSGRTRTYNPPVNSRGLRCARPYFPRVPVSCLRSAGGAMEV